MNRDWQVYLLECLDGSFYTGVTNNLSQRMATHMSGKGSKYVLAKGFKKLMHAQACTSKSDAYKKEYAIKQLSKTKKIEWFTKQSSQAIFDNIY